MEMTLDMKKLDEKCECGSGKLAGNCHRKDEECPCGSEEKVSTCCLPEKENSLNSDSEGKENESNA